jgi:Nucleotidyl transferase AbiEii toxin, Type IV TA system
MKDYYDVWMLTCSFELEPQRMRAAIEATFARRNTKVPAEIPDGLSEEFSADAGKQRQWDAFARALSGQVPDFDRVVRELRKRLMVFASPRNDRL